MGTIVQRGESWRAVVRKKGHRTLTKTFKKHALAKRWVADTEHALERKEVVSNEASIGDLMQRYIDQVVPSRNLSKLTQYHYKQLARWTAKLRLQDLTPDKLVAWKAEFCPEASAASFDRYLSTIWGVLKDAEAFWQISIPYAQMRKARTVLKRLGMLRKAGSRDRRPEPGELDRIKSSISTTLPLADLIDFAVITGMRAGEIVRLRRDDLRQDKRMILVRDRKHPTRKVGNHCWVPLLGESMEILLKQPGGDPLFFPFKSETLTRAFMRSRDAAGVVGLHFHDLRHEAISRMFEAGYSIPEVAVVSGHISWSELRKYTNLKPESLHAGPIRDALVSSTSG